MRWEQSYREVTMAEQGTWQSIVQGVLLLIAGWVLDIAEELQPPRRSAYSDGHDLIVI